MKKEISAHVDMLFLDAPDNRITADIKEELIANLNDKYDDLTGMGITPEDAFAQTISSIGDIRGLLGFAQTRINPAANDTAKQRQMSGVLLSLGVSLYIIALAVSLPAAYWMGEMFAGMFFLVICAAATGLIVYSNTVGGGKYQKINDTFAEEYKERLTGFEHSRKLLGAMSSALWTFTAAAYLAISFLTGWWHITWIIFIIAACVQQLLAYAFGTQRKKAWHGILWTSIVVVYFVLSFGTGQWSYTWLVFVAAAAVEQIIRLALLWRIPQ